MGDAAREKIDRLVIEVFREIRAGGGFASDAISRTFRREKTLSGEERAEIAASVYACLRWIRRVEFALGEGADPGAQLIASQLFEGRIDLATAVAHRPEIEWSRAIAPRIVESEVERFGIEHSLPDFLAASFLEELGAGADAAMRALNRPAPQVVRANLLHGDRDVIASQLAKEGLRSRPGKFSAASLVIDPPGALFSTEAFARGDFEVMDEGSQLIAELVAPPPGGTVVDVCAGAGGKTLAIAALLEGRGRVIALDIAENKLAELRRRARRAGASNIRAIQVSPEGPWPEAVAALEGRSDRVLVDAPCTGLGVFRRNPEARWRMSAEMFDQLPIVQAAIVRRALRLVAPGGRLIYSTCTLRRRENEEIVRALLSEEPSLERVRIAEIYGRSWADPIVDPSGFALSLSPHQHDTDGFYAAVIRRRR